MAEEQRQQQQEDEQSQSFAEIEAQPQNGEAVDNQGQEYSWPEIRFDVLPYRSYHFHRQFRSPFNPNNFLKSVKW